jgi:hypothetical protein
MKQSFERLLLGHTLAGRYRVDEVVGAGGMSVVFRGHDLTLGRPVAVKVVSLPAESDDMRANLRERFRREAAASASIPHHPNVVQVYDYGTDPGLDLDFIVMELLRGSDLKEHLTRGAPPLPEGLRIIRDAARGVAAGHRAGIVHRDVKPANVFLVGGRDIEFVRVLDFGIAKPLRAEGQDALTTIGQLPHSPAYASPEQVDPALPVTAASDVYQLGLVAFETLTGERPYTEAERERARAGDEVPLRVTDRWSAIPPAIRDVVARALRTDARARYRDAAEFVEALVAAEQEPTVMQPVPVVVEPAAATRTMAEPPPARAEPPAAPVRRGGTRRLALLAPLALVGLLLLWGLTRRAGAGDPAVPAVPDTSAMAALEDTFAGMQGRVAEGTPATPPSAPPASGAPVKTTEQLSAEVEQRVRDLNNAWVQGELSRHVGHYASRVDYYNSRNLPRSGVRRDRARDLRRYKVDRQIVFHRVAVSFTAADEARVLVDKEWTFRSTENTRRGRGLQEYLMKRDKDDGEWYVTSEKLLQRNEADLPVPGS